MRRPTLYVVVAGIAAMIAAIIVYSALKKREAEVERAMVKSVEIVVAARDLPLGTKIDSGSVTFTEESLLRLEYPLAEDVPIHFSIRGVRGRLSSVAS